MEPFGLIFESYLDWLENSLEKQGHVVSSALRIHKSHMCMPNVKNMRANQRSFRELKNILRSASKK